jgi:glycosyltransferase involved in cell wall biosynthesis
MKILSFSHDGNLYGAQRSLLTLLNGLRKNGHEIKLIIPSSGGLSAVADSEGIPAEIIPFPYPSSKPIKAIRYLREYGMAAAHIRSYCTEYEPDILHYNTAACVAPAMALKSHEAVKIWHLRESVPMKSVLSRMIASWCDQPVANCWHTALAYPYLVNKGKITVVHNGLSLEVPAEKRVEIIGQEFQGIAPVIAFAGQLLPHKDPVAMIHAAAALRARGKQFRMVILGEGRLMKSLEKKVEKLHLADIVRLTGFVENAIDYLAAADIVAIPSLVEPFPRIGLEAMALGKAVVATTAGGIPEQVIDGTTGILVKPGDHKVFTDALETLIDDSELRRNMGMAGKKRHHLEFSQQVYVAKFEEVVRSVIKRM